MDAGIRCKARRVQLKRTPECEADSPRTAGRRRSSSVFTLVAFALRQGAGTDGRLRAEEPSNQDVCEQESRQRDGHSVNQSARSIERCHKAAGRTTQGKG